MSTSLTIARDFSADPARVFSAWTNAEAIMKWWGLPGYVNVSASFEAREGGTWAVTSRSPEGQEMTARGRVLTCIANELLVYDWRFDSMPPEAPSSLVTVRFSPKGNGTHILLEHANLPGPDAIPLFRQGWEFTIGNFEEKVFARQAA